jgi:hypothetical protein
MAYAVEALDDDAAVDPEDNIRIPRATAESLAYMAQGTVPDRTPIPGHTFALFVREVTVNGVPTPKP